MEAFSITDIGKRRRSNQDYAFYSLQPIGPLPNLFLVADGMGGHQAGDYASRCAVETILEEVRRAENTNSAEVLIAAIQSANKKILTYSAEDEKLRGMGTTIVAATCEGNRLAVANVGDSRLYVINREEIRQITQDHSFVEEMVRYGGISREQARRHPDRNIITRAVGVADNLKVDCFFVTLQENDKVLLCTDGLTNMLDDSEIQGIVAGEEGNIRSRAETLVETANNNGGRDNISVILMEPFSEEVKE